MTQQVINIGSTPNDSTGDPLRTAFDKINTNFNELYSGGAGASNFRLQNNTMSSTAGNINIAPNADSDVVIGPTNQLYVSNTAASTNGYTGSLIVAGGVGIAGDLNVAGTIYSTNADFGSLNATPIGNVTPATGVFTTVDATRSNATIFKGSNVVTETSYVSALANFYNMKALSSDIGNSYAANLSVANTFVANNASISNAYIFGGSISGVSISVTGVENTPIGAVTPNTAVFTKMTTANAQITGGNISGVNITPSSLNGSPIGNATPSSGVFTNLQVTTGNIRSYFNGAIGANTANTGSFTTANVSGNLNVTGNIYAGNLVISNNSIISNATGLDIVIGNIAATANLVINRTTVFSKDAITYGNVTATGNISAGNLILGDDNTIRSNSLTKDIIIGQTTATANVVINRTSVFNKDVTIYGNINSNLNFSAANITSVGGQIIGYHTGAIGANVSNTGSFTNVTITGNLIANNFTIVGNISGSAATASSATTAGTATYASTAGLATNTTTVVQPYQGNITGLGNLANLTVLATATVGNLSTGGTVGASGNISTPKTLFAANVSAGNLSLDVGNLTITSSFTVANSYGRSGDLKGKIVWDAGNVYICITDYTTGTSPIWKRAALSSY